MLRKYFITVFQTVRKWRCFSKAENKKHRMAWVEKDHNDHRVSIPLLCAGSPTITPGCPEPHPAWPWVPSGTSKHLVLPLWFSPKLNPCCRCEWVFPESDQQSVHRHWRCNSQVWVGFALSSWACWTLISRLGAAASTDVDRSVVTATYPAHSTHLLRGYLEENSCVFSSVARKKNCRWALMVC